VILHDKAKSILRVLRASLVSRANLRGLAALHMEIDMTLLERLAELLAAPYLTRVFRLALLAPEVVEAILDGRQPPSLSLEVLRDQLPVGCLRSGGGSVTLSRCRRCCSGS
jgi:hypothetical protein